MREITKYKRFDRIEDALYRWMLYLDNAEGDILEQIAKQEPMIRKAIDIEKAFMKSDQDRYLYELREKGRRDYMSVMNYAEEKGEARGEAKAKQSIALSMLAMKMKLEDIAKATGLSIAEIKKLK